MRRTLGLVVLALMGPGGCSTEPKKGGDKQAEPRAVATPVDAPGEAPQEKKMTDTSAKPAGLHAFKMKDIDGRHRDLSEYRGKVVLVVNVASKCGYTKQYAGLEALYAQYKTRGLIVLGVPSNDFGQQEPGSEAEIKEFCTSRYNVTFPMLAKVPVKNGPEQTALYQYLSDKSKNGVLDAKVAWNFNKFLVGKDGQVIKHYESKVTPEDEGLRKDIEKALAQTG